MVFLFILLVNENILFLLLIISGLFFFFSYDSEGRLTNVTFPTGVVTNLHGEMERAITVDIESSSREEDVSITSNLSSIDSFYTMVQGTVNKRFLTGY